MSMGCVPGLLERSRGLTSAHPGAWLQGPNSASSYIGSMPASGPLTGSLPLIKETDASPFVNGGTEPMVRNPSVSKLQLQQWL
jgi:hypothetical protein